MERGGQGTVLASAIGDADLVRACRTGRPGAWSLLVQRFSRYVYAIAAQGFRLSEPDAEDVFQEVFARAYEHLDRLRDDAAIRPWLAQLTRRLAVDRLRVSSREQVDEAALEIVDGQASAELDRLDTAMSVRQAMQGLSEDCQEILDRFFARDESYATIAEATGIPMGTIASRISRCLTKLRGLLEDPDEVNR
jgi:RNA polymerase sigma-70 factor (ECF subfamily)